MKKGQGRKMKKRRSARITRKVAPKTREESIPEVGDQISASPVPPKSEHVTLIVIGWDGERHLFRLRDCAGAMGRLKRAFARRCRMDPAAIRLILDGRTLRDIECPLLLFLEDGDKVEVGWAY